MTLDVDTIKLISLKKLMEMAIKQEDDLGTQLIAHLAALYYEFKSIHSELESIQQHVLKSKNESRAVLLNNMEKNKNEEEKKKDKDPTDSILLTELEKICSRGSLRNRIEHNSMKNEYYLTLYNFEFYPFKITGDKHWYIKLCELFDFLEFLFTENNNREKPVPKLNWEILNKRIPTKYILSSNDLSKLSGICNKYYQKTT